MHRSDIEKAVNYQTGMAAVMKVFRENEEAQQRDKKALEAKSDSWATHSLDRQHIYTRFRFFWAQLTGLEEKRFPFNMDFVCEWYMTIRKRPDEWRERVEDEAKNSAGGAHQGNMFLDERL